MAPHPPAVGVAKVTIVQSCSGRSFGDSIYVCHTDLSPWTVTQLAALASDASSSYDATILGLQDPPVTHVNTVALDLSDTAGRTGIAPSGVGGGATPTKMLPLNSVAHVAFEVPRRYRGGRPGYNISGLDASMMTDERSFSTAAVTAITSAVSTWIANTLTGSGLGGPVFQAGVSYLLDKLVRPTPLVLPISEMETQQRLCTLRKRLGKIITP